MSNWPIICVGAGMLVLEKGRYRARIAETPDDVAAAQTLRHDCFGLNHAHGLDQDAFDDLCEHMLVEEVETSDLICCYRIMHLNSGDDITRSYSAQYYNLSALQSYPVSYTHLTLPTTPYV